MMKKALIATYVIAIHLMLALTIIKGNFIERAKIRLGFDQSPDAPIIAALRGVHAQMDPNVPAGATIFLGDSITMALPTAALVDRSVNYGIGYQRSDQLIESMHTYRSLARARLVVITIGTNDILQGRAEGIAERYGAILSAVPQGVPVLMSSPPPTRRGDVLPVREAARAACAARARCTFVDASTIKMSGLLEDGVHLNPSGYAEWLERLRSGIGLVTH